MGKNPFSTSVRFSVLKLMPGHVIATWCFINTTLVFLATSDAT
jgi:hypothetical protein